jgi:hypothetical protein
MRNPDHQLVLLRRDLDIIFIPHSRTPTRGSRDIPEYSRRPQSRPPGTSILARTPFASIGQAQYLWSLFSRFLIAAVVLLALALSAAADLPAAAQTNKTVGTHKLIVAVKKTMAPAAEKNLAVLVLISQNGGAPAGALATPSKPLTVLQQNGGLYRVKA